MTSLQQSLPAELAEMQTYYRLRAPVHHAEAMAYMADVFGRLVQLMRDSGALTGHVLELACGTGLCTVPLSEMARHVDAMDGAPEMLDQLARRGLANVTTTLQNLFDLHPEAQWDGIFFSNWVCHVPLARLHDFWSALSLALRTGGRVLFADADPTEAEVEYHVFESEDGTPMARRPAAGRDFNVVKHFWEPDELLALLATWGWSGSATRLADNRGLYLYDVGRVQ